METNYYLKKIIHLKNKFDTIHGEFQRENEGLKNTVLEISLKNVLQAYESKTVKQENRRPWLFERRRKEEEEQIEVKILSSNLEKALKEAMDNANQHNEEKLFSLSKNFDQIVQMLRSDIEEEEIMRQQWIEKRRKTEELKLDKEQQQKHEIQDFKEKIKKLEKENEMLSVTVDKQSGENRRLDTKLRDMKESFRKSVENLKMTNAQLREEIIYKDRMIEAAQRNLYRSKSLSHIPCSHGEIRSNMKDSRRRDTKGKHQQKDNDHTEPKYEFTRRSKSADCLICSYMQQENEPLYGPQSPTSPPEYEPSCGLQRPTSETKTYNIFHSSANFQKDCSIKAFTANTNANPSVTND